MKACDLLDLEWWKSGGKGDKGYGYASGPGPARTESVQIEGVEVLVRIETPDERARRLGAKS